MRRAVAYAFLLVAVLCLTSSAAQADITNTINIYDVNDPITATLNGSPVTLTPGPGPEEVSFTYDRGGAPVFAGGSSSSGLLEPGSTVVSDMVEAIYTSNSTMVTVHFCSEPSNFAFCTGDTNLPAVREENGSLVFVVSILDSPPCSPFCVTDTFNVASSPDQASAVPEPASLILLGSGLVGVARVKRSKRRQ